MKITVCICTFKRDQLLKRLLHSLADIDLSGLTADCVEALVVNNAPNGQTLQICQEMGPHLPVPLRYVEETTPGLVNTRNRAVTEALASGADAIAFIDDDDVPDGDWLAQLVSALTRYNADVVAGNRRFNRPPPWSRGTSERRHKKSVYKRVGKGEIPRGAATCNVLISKDILLKLLEHDQVFRPEFTLSGGEDKDFFLRAAESGAKIVFAEDSFVTQYNEQDRYSVRGVFRRGLKSGCSKMNITLGHEPHRKVFSLVANTLAKLALTVAVLPFSAFSRKNRLSHIYRLGKSLGMLYFLATGKSIKYYSRKNA